jgi:aminopeptidase S
MSTRGPISSFTKRVLVGVFLLIAATACSLAPTAQPSARTQPGAGISVPDGPLMQQLRAAVSDDGSMTHLNALQKIADENGGNRTAGSRGYEASVEYVAGVLRGAGFITSTPTYGSDGDRDRAATGRNVIAQTDTGDPGRVVVIGAHLDSVPEGPGIVDNGSGVATLLEIATRLGARPDVRNAVRFAFFGSEENDADGSSGYVDSLSRNDRQKIKLYLNVDMVASPNAGYIVQGGTGDDEETAGPPGSATIGRVLAGELAKTGIATPEITEFVGDDESAFIGAGIPAGGAENGDAKKKTAEQARIWGGQAGEVYDHCYHQACDGIGNVNREVLDHYLKAIAGTLAHFATSTDELR